MCLRDDSGTFLLAKVLQFDQVYLVAVGEALGLYHVIQWMQDMQFDNIGFELDSKIMRDAFHSLATYITDFGNIIDECREQFFSSFTNSRVEFVWRQLLHNGVVRTQDPRSGVSNFLWWSRFEPQTLHISYALSLPTELSSRGHEV